MKGAFKCLLLKKAYGLANSINKPMEVTDINLGHYFSQLEKIVLELQAI